MQRPRTTGPLASLERPEPRVSARVPVPTREPRIALVSASSQTKDQPGQLRADRSVQPQAWVRERPSSPPARPPVPPILALSLGACLPSPPLPFAGWLLLLGKWPGELWLRRRIEQSCNDPEKWEEGPEPPRMGVWDCSCFPPKCGSFVYSAGTRLLRNGTFKVILCPSPLQWFPS